MDRLEAVLTSFIEHSDRAQTELQRGQAELNRSLEQFKEELRQDIAGMKEWRVQAQKQWGEIAQKLGSFVEDIVAPNVPRLAREILGLDRTPEELLSGARVRVRHPQDASRIREFDYIYATAAGWILVESKTDPKLKDVDSFREMLAEVREFFPQYAALQLYPIFASLGVPDHLVKYCTRHRIYALGMGPETMQLLNLTELKTPAPPQS